MLRKFSVRYNLEPGISDLGDNLFHFIFQLVYIVSCEPHFDICHVYAFLYIHVFLQRKALFFNYLLFSNKKGIFFYNPIENIIHQ